MTLFIHGKVTGHLYSTVKGPSVEWCYSEALVRGYHPDNFAFEYDTGGVIPEEPECDECGALLSHRETHCKGRCPDRDATYDGDEPGDTP
jgi:hypothetical protein